MKIYIFISCDGHSKTTDRQKENLRVLGFGNGNSAKEAFFDFLSEGEYITRKYFDEVYCFPLDIDPDQEENWFLTKREFFSIQNWMTLENPVLKK